MHSAIYEGRVRHRRMRPAGHSFSYRLFMLYLDLDELDSVFKRRWLWSCRRAAPARFRREDHLGDPAIPLDVAVRDLVEREAGSRPPGPIHDGGRGFTGQLQVGRATQEGHRLAARVGVASVQEPAVRGALRVRVDRSSRVLGPRRRQLGEDPAAVVGPTFAGICSGRCICSGRRVPMRPFSS